MATSASSRGTPGAGRSVSAWMSEKTPAWTPMPIDSTSTIVAAVNGLRAKCRRANRMSPDSESIATAPQLVAGKPWVYVRNVARPTLTVYSPNGKNTGAAIVVFPGGGYQILAIDLEGTEVCDWLTSQGITCVLLKYRVPRSGPSWDPGCKCDLNTRSSMPLEDAQRTISL